MLVPGPRDCSDGAACESGRARPPLALVVLGLVLVAAACRTARVVDEERFEFRAAAMGTEFRIVLFATTRAHAERAAFAALDRVRALDRSLSDYDAESELSRLSRASDEAAPTPWIDASPDLVRVLSHAQGVAADADGAFDVTVGPYARLWRRARRQGDAPDAAALRAVDERVGFRKLEVDDARARVRLLARGMRLDLGGIAKGDAVDQALRVLRAHGVERALVDGGGDLAVGAPPPGKRGWGIELADYGNGARERLVLADAAVATSGDLERFVIVAGERRSHLIDPRDGEALRERRLVTVIASSCIEADALASAFSVAVDRDALLRVRRVSDARIDVRMVTLAGDERRVWRTFE